MQKTQIVKVTGSELDGTARRRNELVTAKFFRLSYQAHRLFLYVLSQVRDEHNEDTEYEFAVNELANAIGIDRSNLYKSMVGILDELSRTMVELPVINDDGEPMRDRIVRVGLIKNRQELRMLESGERRVAGSVTVTLYKELLPYVRRIAERYTEVALKYVFRLSSGYSQKMYDLLKSEEFKRRAWRVGREELFEMLNVEAGKFQNWGDFRRFVLERAQQEINAHTDIAFDIDYVKTGREVTEIVFRMRREGGQNVELMPGTLKHQTFKAMLELGIAAQEAERLLWQWWDVDPERIRWHVGEAKKRAASGEVRSAIGWFRKGVAKDYRPQRALFAVQQNTAALKRTAYTPVTDPDLRKTLQDLGKQMGV